MLIFWSVSKTNERLGDFFHFSLDVIAIIKRETQTSPRKLSRSGCGEGAEREKPTECLNHEHVGMLETSWISFLEMDNLLVSWLVHAAVPRTFIRNQVLPMSYDLSTVTTQFS